MLAAIDALRAAGKRVLLLTVGSSAAARQAARSHTGSMTSALDVVDAAARSVGAIRLDTPARLVAAAQVLALSPPVSGRRTAVLADSGGQAALAADVLTQAGLEVVGFPESVRTSLRSRLPRAALTANPVDLAGAGHPHPRVHHRHDGRPHARSVDRFVPATPRFDPLVRHPYVTRSNSFGWPRFAQYIARRG